MNDNARTIAAVGISMAILLGFQHFSGTDKQAKNPAEQVTSAQPSVPAAPAPALPAAVMIDRDQAVKAGERITFENGTVKGSVSLTGGMLDDLTLKAYRETTDDNSPPIRLLNPLDTANGYAVEGQWLSPQNIVLPDASSKWRMKSGSESLSEGKECTLVWDNGKGLRFERTFSIDSQYMFTVTEKVINNGADAVQLAPGAKIVRRHAAKSSSTVHEGTVGYFNGKLFESKYEDNEQAQASAGWFGLTDRFWLTAIVPAQNQNFSMQFAPQTPAQDKIPGIYRCSFNASAFTVEPGGEYAYGYQVFSGPKVVRILDAYEEKSKIDHFDLAVDFGWFYFLTKPLFFVLEYLHQLIGNLGIAIIIITVLFKIATVPLTAKSMASMRKMRELQPQIEQLKKRHGNDQMKMAQEQRALFQKHGISPLGGCLPMLLQMPIFFCLYKVLLISIEMRHAPFFGWIRDLSAPDPTNLFNLFGLIPWDPPSFMQLGLWPLILGATMLFQQRMTPQTTMDPAQAKMMYVMPLVFTFIFAGFPAGLVIYWTVSNILSIGQQWWSNRT